MLLRSLCSLLCFFCFAQNSLAQNCPDFNCFDGIDQWDEATQSCITIAPVLGCTYEGALNYDPSATCNHGCSLLLAEDGMTICAGETVMFGPFYVSDGIQCSPAYSFSHSNDPSIYTYGTSINGFPGEFWYAVSPTVNTTYVFTDYNISPVCDPVITTVTININPNPCIPCAVGIDKDGDGYCTTDDCDDDDPLIGAIGAPCNDNNPNTDNDVVLSDCTCAGQVIDCLGVAGGSYLPGSSCNDGNPFTIGDVVLADCSCQGLLTDCNGTVDGSYLPGAPCDDLNNTTINDTVQDDCSCLGEFIGIQLTVFLEGFSVASGEMHTELATNNLLPLNQPYSQAPFNYSGSESVTAHSADIVDWILVELRDANDPSNVVEQKAMRLQSDGVVVDENDSPYLIWSSNGSYHVVIKHRSHLAIQSAGTVNTAGATLDFSTDVSQVAGYDQQETVHGITAMRAGDYDQNGTINFFDFILWLANNNLLNVYHSADGSGNGTINFFDFTLWLKNKNYIAVDPIY